jgi:calmodulin
VFDKDGQGTVSSGELRHILTGLGERMEDAEADEMVRQVVGGATGQLNYQTFVREVMK